MIINGEYECGPSPPNEKGSQNRQNYYKLYADMFKVWMKESKKRVLVTTKFND